VIPAANITAWRRHAPWAEDRLVEQDLVLSRALVEMFRHPVVAEHAAFRGGTALHKLFFDPPGRYSEDIDLVQRHPGPIGPLANAIREVPGAARRQRSACSPNMRVMVSPGLCSAFCADPRIPGAAPVVLST